MVDDCIRPADRVDLRYRRAGAAADALTFNVAGKGVSRTAPTPARGSNGVTIQATDLD
jgi:hypothetical protein